MLPSMAAKLLREKRVNLFLCLNILWAITAGSEKEGLLQVDSRTAVRLRHGKTDYDARLRGNEFIRVEVSQIVLKGDKVYFCHIP